ncbi:hypothetical protein ACCO45_012700 [Purpureocillium lilacinum]|uniref:Uncharacterized protein n=1 Tax=Purpureocillium lilacinum TaxID=33203 RepID=A0ACC4DAB7_PURLI
MAPANSESLCGSEASEPAGAPGTKAVRKDRGSSRPGDHRSLGKVPVRESPEEKEEGQEASPLGPIRDFPCRPCVTRAVKAPGHECASQNNTGAACWDCAKNGHTCKPVPIDAVAAVRVFWQLNKQLKLTQEEPNDAWSQAAQQAAQQMRACGPGAAASSAASGPLHVLPPTSGSFWRWRLLPKLLAFGL